MRMEIISNIGRGLKCDVKKRMRYFNYKHADEGRDVREDFPE